jgi:hypothetical protein
MMVQYVVSNVFDTLYTSLNAVLNILGSAVVGQLNATVGSNVSVTLEVEVFGPCGFVAVVQSIYFHRSHYQQCYF